MICPKCKAELPDNTIRCPHCKVRLNVICPECKTVNHFGATHCKNCSTELIKICPVCKSYNFPDSKECRKCHTPFNISEENLYSELKNSQQESGIVHSYTSSATDFSLSETELSLTDNDSLPIENSMEKIFNVKESPFDFDSLENNFNEAVKEEKEEDKEETNELHIDSVEDLVVDVNDSLESENTQPEKETEKADKEEGNEEAQESENTLIQKGAVNKVINIIKTSVSKNIIAVNGEEGCGKSAVLNQVKNIISQEGFICLEGSLTPLLQITSFGFFQDAFLRIMGFPPFTKTRENFVRDFKRSKYAKIFNCLSSTELTLFLNIFYPCKEDEFKNILENKKGIFSILEKVITSLLINNKVIIIIDNFELLDGASYDFIMHLIEKGFFNNRLKLLVAYQEKKSIQSYFDLSVVDEKVFETIILKKFTKEELISSVDRVVGISIEKILPDDFINMLVKKSNGNAIRMEQEAALLFDVNYITIEDDKITLKEANKPEVNPDSFEELLKLRLNILSPIAKNMLYMAAMMGYRFSTSILAFALELANDKSLSMLDFLSKELYIQFVDNYTCEFKSLTLWKIIYKEAKSDSLYKENSLRLYNVLKSLILSSNLQKLISCSLSLSKKEEYDIWQNTSKLAAKLGDTNLYVIAKKQCLQILDNLKEIDSDEIRAEIYEEIGKLLCEKSPDEAINYLSTVLDANLKAGDVKKVTDISGYFVKSCYLTGNYFGAAEAVDAVVSSLSGAISSVTNIDLSLIRTRKLEALLNIGNTEQIINLVNEELIPDIEQALALSDNEKNPNRIYFVDAWINSMIVLAKAYSLQGNKKVFDTVLKLKEFVNKNDYNREYYLTQIKILEAAANTVIGKFHISDDILFKLSEEYKIKKMETDLLVQWNLVNIINRIFLEQTDNIKSDLFELAAFSNNINEHSMKNIVKLILGYILKEEGNKIKALEIFNEEITYFAKEKIAIGAMLAWALIVQISVSNGDLEKALNTANKSLEIAQSSKINNYFFCIYFQKFIAEIYQLKRDFVASKMYFEKAIMIAKQQDLKFQLIELYLSFAKYMEDFMQTNKMYTSEYVNLAQDMYNKALNCAKELNLQNMMEKIVKSRTSFKLYCQLHSIEI